MSFLAGSVLRSTVTFTPESGTVLLADVTATVIDAEGLETELTPVAGVANVFSATFTVPDDAISGPWTVRWESANPKIVVETTETITASALATP